MKEPNLDDLVQSAEDIVGELDSTSDLKRLQFRRVYPTMEHGVEKSFARNTQNEIKASRLLGNKACFEVPNTLTEKLESLSSVSARKSGFQKNGAFAKLLPMKTTDIKQFLRSERETALLNAIEYSRKYTMKDSGTFADDCRNAWWEQEKKNIVYSLSGISSFGKENLLESLYNDVSHSQFMAQNQRNNALLAPSRDGIPPSSMMSPFEACYGHFVRQCIYRQKKLSSTGVMLVDNQSSRLESSLGSILFTHMQRHHGSNEAFLMKNFSLELFPECAEFWDLLHSLTVDTVSPSVSSGSGVNHGSESDGLHHHSHYHKLRQSLSHFFTPWDLRENHHWQHKLTIAAIRFLERGYVEFARNTIYSKPREARLGGVPGTKNLAKAFLKVKLSSHSMQHIQHTSFGLSGNEDERMAIDFEDGYIGGHPVWAMIHFCMRCGDFEAALELASEAGENLSEFVRWLKLYISNDRVIPGEELQLVQNFYRNIVRDCTDPYKRLVFCILGRCNPLDDHSDITASIDDFLWLRLNQLTWPGDGNASQLSDQKPTPTKLQRYATPQSLAIGSVGIPLTLVELQQRLLEDYGESHFDALKQPFLYAKILLLTQQFEAALDFLSKIESHCCHAVHAALVLMEKGLLVITESPQDPLLVFPTDGNPFRLRRLNLGRLVLAYAKRYEADNLRCALDYYQFLRRLPHPNVSALPTANVFEKAVLDLCLHCKAFRELFGWLDDSYERLPGLLDEYDVNVEDLMQRVVHCLEKDGYLEECLILYNLAGNLRKALHLANLILSSHLLRFGMTEAVSQFDNLNLIQKLASRTHKQGADVSTKRCDGSDVARSEQLSDYRRLSFTLLYLLDIFQYFQAYANRDWPKVLQIMDALELVPQCCERVQANAVKLQKLPDELTRLIGPILLSLMRTVVEYYQANQHTDDISMNSSSVCTPFQQNMRDRASALLAFAGHVSHRISGDVYGKLVRYEQEIV